MQLIIVKLLIGYPRFNFDLGSELANYMDFVWLHGWLQFDAYKYEDFNFEKHRVLKFGKTGKIRKRFGGLLDDFGFILRVVSYLKRKPADLVIIHSHRLVLCPILYRKPK